MTTRKKQYEKPAMQVYECKFNRQLLAGSSVSAGDADAVFDAVYDEETFPIF